MTDNQDKLLSRINKALGKEVRFRTLFGIIEDLLNKDDQSQKIIEGYIVGVDELEGMLQQANNRIKDLENQLSVKWVGGIDWAQKTPYEDLDD
jgi:hypothetical protein